MKILNCFEVMGNALEDFRHLVLSAICDTLCDAGVAPAARQVCLSCLSSLPRLAPAQAAVPFSFGHSASFRSRSVVV